MENLVYRFEDMITTDKKMLEIIEKAKKVSGSYINLLIVGENGTGKNMLARAIHLFKGDAIEDFHSINCVNFSFVQKEEGGNADFPVHGTIFLDEIADLSLEAQSKLLTVMEASESKGDGLRIVGATNKDVIELVREGKLREDLYYRLSEISFQVPPLRERKEDINLLIDHFINKFNQDFGKDIEGMSKVGLSYLLNYDWPGNIRELENMIKAAVALSEKSLLWLEDIPFKISLTGKAAVENTIRADYSLKQAEKEHILRVLNMCRWNKSKSAKLLKISRPRLDRKIEEYKLKKP